MTSEQNNELRYEFGFNNQLPRVFELVNAIVAVVHAAAFVLEKIWSEAFSSCHVKSLSGIKKHISSVLVKYSNFMKNNRGKNVEKRKI